MWVFEFNAPTIQCVPNQTGNLGALLLGYLEPLPEAGIGHDTIRKKLEHGMLVTSFDAFRL